MNADFLLRCYKKSAFIRVLTFLSVWFLVLLFLLRLKESYTVRTRLLPYPQLQKVAL